MILDANWAEQLKLLIAALILLTSFMLLLQNRIHKMISTYIWQSGLLVAAILLQAIKLGDFYLYLSAFLTLSLKVVAIPYALRYLVVKLNIRHKVTMIKRPFLLLLAAAAIVLFCYYLILPVRESSLLLSNNVIAIAMAVMILGMTLLITHRKAISHVLGFMAMENGIFFAALVSTNGMPMTVELGVAFDVLIVAVLFGVFLFHLRSSIDSFDVDRLNLLREDEE